MYASESSFNYFCVGDVVNISLGFLSVVFCFAIIIPIFPTLCEHNLVTDTLILVLTIRVMIRLVI